MLKIQGNSRGVKMKLVYYGEDERKLFEIKLEKLEKIDELDIVEDSFEIEEENIKLFDSFKEEINIYQPLDDGNDFYLQYYNHIYYFSADDKNFVLGSKISQTTGKFDKEKKLLNMLKTIYKTGKDRRGIIKILRNNGKLFKYINFHYFMSNNKLMAIHEDNTELMMYRESILNNKTYGVAIYQNYKFVEVNENYARIVCKTREQLLGEAQDLQGVPEEMAKTIFKEVKAIYNQEKLSYKTPMVSYDKDGNIRYFINAEGSYITYNNMPAVLFKIKDLTEQEKAKRLNETNADKNIRLESTIKELRKYSKTFISYAIYPDNYGVSENFYDIIEDDNKEYPFTKDTLRSFIVGDDLDLYDSMINSLSPTNPEVEFTTSIMTLKFNIKYVRHYFKRWFDSKGTAKSYISAHQDITEEASYSNSLKKQIFEQNKIIKNKDIQIKEAHHTIKNNLNILLSLIRLQEHNNKDPEAVLEDTKAHINSISIMHEKLYQSQTLEDVELKEYIDSIVKSLLEIYSSKIKYISKVDNITLNSDQTKTLGLIINELINNTVKYAFPDNQEGSIQIKISRTDKIIEVEYKDNGIGIPEDVDFDNPTSLGLIVIQSLTKQIGGQINYSYENGTYIRLVFEEKESF